jgi:hypothetical protein
MKWFVLLAVLAGWLVSELKDFFKGGALDNPLALILLKIVFICAVILMVAFCLVTSRRLPRITYHYPKEDQNPLDRSMSETSSMLSEYCPPKRGRESQNTRLTTRANSVREDLNN